MGLYGRGREIGTPTAQIPQFGHKDDMLYPQVRHNTPRLDLKNAVE